MDPIIELDPNTEKAVEDVSSFVQANLEAEQKREEEEKVAAEQAPIEEVEDKELNLGDRVKDVAVSGVVGLRVTASSFITLPEQVIDFATGEMAREAKEGVVAISGDERKTSIIEVNCETDFVAKNDDFINFTANASPGDMVDIFTDGNRWYVHGMAKDAAGSDVKFHTAAAS